MNGMLKPKIGQVLKTPEDKSVNVDGDVDNTDASAIHNTLLSSQKRVAKQSDVNEIKDNLAPYAADVSEIAKDDRSYKNVAGTREYRTDMPVKISGRKELTKSQETSHKHMSVDRHDESSTVAVKAVDSEADEENFESKSVYDEDASVSDDELVFDGGRFDYETSSMSLGIYTDHATNEALFTDDKTEEGASYCHSDSPAAEDEKQSSSLCSQKSSRSGIISGHDSVSSDRLISSNSSDDIDRHLASLFENSGNAAVTATTDNETPKSRVLSQSSLDRHSKSDAGNACDERKFSIKQRSLQSLSPSANSSDFRLRSVNSQDSAGNEEKKSAVTLHSLQNLSSSDWHLASMVYEEPARGTECSRRKSTEWNLSSAVSSQSHGNSSEWHINSLLFENSDVYSRPLAGDLHVRVS